MKLRRLISAFVVFTLVMTCAVCSVSAANVKFTTTTSYNATTSEVTVETKATVTSNSMVSYIIYGDDTLGGNDTVNQDNIKYIDQQTATSGSVTFTVTDAIAKLGNRSIMLGSNADTLSPTVEDVDDVVRSTEGDAIFVSIDSAPIIGTNSDGKKTLTFLVHQSGKDVTTGINVYAYDKTTKEKKHEFLGLANYNGQKYYAIRLVDDTDGDYINSDNYDYVAEPYYINDSNEEVTLTTTGDTAYYTNPADITVQ